MNKQKQSNIKYTEEVLLIKWLDQCTNALKYIHDRSKMHRDIKLLNIFLTIDDNVKLGDFGISLTVEGTIQTSKGFGTELYNSPELNKANKYNYKSDVWLVICQFGCFLFIIFYLRSLGISFYELAIYDLPFKYVDDISHKPYHDLPDYFSRKYNTLIKKCSKQGDCFLKYKVIKTFFLIKNAAKKSK